MSSSAWPAPPRSAPVTVTTPAPVVFYLMTIRATGLGLGIGRIGAIIAPILIGILVSLSLPLEMNFITSPFRP